jgi:diguanylate cyclase (GGDEF)-like protein
VILENLDAADREAAARIAEKLRQMLAEPYHLRVPGAGEEVTHNCTASIGVCPFHGHDEARGELIKRADIAMYRAKSAGRNAIRFYEDSAAREEEGLPG